MLPNGLLNLLPAGKGEARRPERRGLFPKVRRLLAKGFPGARLEIAFPLGNIPKVFFESLINTLLLQVLPPPGKGLLGSLEER